MAGRWELVVIESDGLYFYSPQGFQKIKRRDYLKSKGWMLSDTHWETEHREIICCLLADGWEPSLSYIDMLRRKTDT